MESEIKENDAFKLNNHYWLLFSTTKDPNIQIVELERKNSDDHYDSHTYHVLGEIHKMYKFDFVMRMKSIFKLLNQ